MSGDPGEERQIDDIYRAHAAHLYNVALLGASGDRGKAKTLVQETFQAAWEKRDMFLSCEPEHQRRWLFRVLRNNIIKSFTRGAGRFERLQENPEIGLEQHPAGPTSPLRAVLLRDVLDQCWDVIKAMSPTCQKVFFMRAEEWKPGEIAEALGITTSTVRDHVQAGLRQLNARIGPTAEIFTDLEDENESGTQR